VRLVVETDPHAGWEAEVLVNRPDATVGDLASAIDPALTAATPLVIDGRLVGADVGLAESGLVDGAVVRLDGGIDEASPHPAAAELRVLSGLEAGRREPLPPGEVVVGRHDGADVLLDDLSVSRQGHCRITVSSLGDCSVVDLGSTNGTRVGAHPASEPTPVPPGAVLGVQRVPVAGEGALSAPTSRSAARRRCRAS